MSAVIELLKSHRSIRKYTTQKIDEELFQQIVEAGQAAAERVGEKIIAVHIIPNLDPEVDKILFAK